MNQDMSGKPGESPKIALRSGVGGNHLEHRTTGQAIELQLGLEQRQRAVQATGVQLGVVLYNFGHCFTPGALPDGRFEAPRIPQVEAALVAGPVSGYSKDFADSEPCA